jgi:exopolyphosphatase/pppGpp-phosphohydrolase
VRIGAAGLTSAVAADAPPVRAAMSAMREAARDAVSAAPAAAGSEVVLVGGTASNLLKVLGRSTDDRLDRPGLNTIRGIVTAEPSSAIAERYVVRPQRARLLGAGAAIVEAILDRYGAGGARVSHAGIREGAVLAVIHAGPAWRDRLDELAHGWVR